MNKSKQQVATDGARWYRISRACGYRYFRIGRDEAQILLSTEQAIQVPYQPLSRPELGAGPLLPEPAEATELSQVPA